jgi:hypothetical protein
VGLRASLDDVEKRKFLTLPGLELRDCAIPAPYYHTHIHNKPILGEEEEEKYGKLWSPWGADI